MATIVLTGGGTAGHVTPHLAILPYLKKDFDKIYYIGSKFGIEKGIIEKADIPYYDVPCVKLNRRFTLKNVKIPFVLISGVKKAGKILDKIKPDVIFSKGGYVALPVVLAGAKRKIPIITHESDYTIGLANKISAKYSAKNLTSFPHTATTIKKGVYVGSPIRQKIYNKSTQNNYSRFNFSGKKPVLLVTGGSQGAMAINVNLRLALPKLIDKFDIIHICGKGNLDEKIEYKGYFQTEYLSDIEHAFSITSVCVSRAGSNTLFELLSLNIPTLLIPLPKGVSRGDQILNAEYFEKLGITTVLNQESLSPDSLSAQIYATYNNRAILMKNFENAPIKDASRKISNIIASYKK